MMNRFALALLAIAACKSKEQPAPAAASGSAAVADAVAVAVADAAAAAAPPPAPVAPAAPMPSETLVASVPETPLRSPDGSRVVWCTRGDNGMAEWAEVVCHIASPGKKTSVIPILTYADAMAVDEGVDPAGDADAGVKADAARDRVQAGLARLAADGGADLVAMPPPIACSFQGGEFVRREDDPLGSHDACKQGAFAVHVTAPGKVTVVDSGKSLFAEVFKARPRGKGDGDTECYLEASTVELSIDRETRTIAIAVALSNPSDACALVTEYEVRAVKYRESP